MIAQVDITMQPYQGLVEDEIGFLRGSVWNNLYIPYKFEAKGIPAFKNERDGLLFVISMYSFYITDIRLYLDIHYDSTLLEQLKMYQEKYENCKKYYEKKYGPLCQYYEKNNDYIKGPWPWEVKYVDL